MGAPSSARRAPPGAGATAARARRLASLAVLPWLLAAAPAARSQEPAEPPAAEKAGSGEEPVDETARFYVRRCTGCHTIGEGELDGPDLQDSTTWPVADLVPAIERMEKNVGPMSDARVTALAELLQDPRVQERIGTAGERLAGERAADLPPARAEAGRALFFGERAFAEGGLACAACHSAEGRGGNLAAPLHDAASRLGHSALVSAGARPGYPLMKASYRDEPLREQEARHVAAYLESLQGPPPPGAEPVAAIGWSGTLLALAAVGAGGLAALRRASGVRRRLVERARRS